MLTVSKLARCCGLSRSTILYYERRGLLRRAPRSPGNYRSYSDADLARLQQIRAYRDAGLKLADVRVLLDERSNQAAVLKRRLLELDREIVALREHQQAILRLVRARGANWRKDVMTKEKWVSILRAAGFTEADMHRWHQQFEKSAPEEHQEFLQYLKIPPEEIRHIREQSRKV